MSRLSKAKRKFFRDVESSIYIHFVTSYNLNYRSPLVRVIPYEKSYDVAVCLPFMRSGVSVYLYYSYNDDMLKKLLEERPEIDVADATANAVVQDILEQLDESEEINNG